MTSTLSKCDVSWDHARQIHPPLLSFMQDVEGEIKTESPLSTLSILGDYAEEQGVMDVAHGARWLFHKERRPMIRLGIGDLEKPWAWYTSSLVGYPDRNTMSTSHYHHPHYSPVIQKKETLPGPMFHVLFNNTYLTTYSKTYAYYYSVAEAMWEAIRAIATVHRMLQWS